VLNDAARTGLSFGITSGLITTMGLIVGLHSGTHSRLAVIGGILTIAVADAFSDALGIHVAQESQNHHSTNAIWTSTFATLFAKFFSALTFMVPILLLPMQTAIVASVLWGLLLLGGISFYVAKERGVSPWPVVGEHVLIALVLVGITHYLGEWIAGSFGFIESDTDANRFGYGSGPGWAAGLSLFAGSTSVLPTHQPVSVARRLPPLLPQLASGLRQPLREAIQAERSNRGGPIMFGAILITGVATILLMLLAIHRIWRLSSGRSDQPGGDSSPGRLEDQAD
jgi:hypothetical protein